MASAPIRLTRKMADEIVSIVKKDATCVTRIQDVVFGKLPPGYAGGARNVYQALTSISGCKYIITGEKDVELLEMNCEGIAFATCAAISKSKPSFVPSVTEVHRVLDGWHHRATLVQLSKFGPVVFDWHATLQIDNPLIYRTKENFLRGVEPVRLDTFRGF